MKKPIIHVSRDTNGPTQHCSEKHMAARALYNQIRKGIITAGGAAGHVADADALDVVVSLKVYLPP